MMKLIASVLAPLTGLFIIMLSNGMFSTLIAVRLQMDGASDWVAGAASGAYYGGLMISAFYIERFICRVGHIRAYATFASITAAVSLLPGLILSPESWIAMRFIGGYCMGGLFIVIESWLLASSTIKTRGKVLSIYMIALYGAQGAGQFLLNISDPLTLIPFCIATILASLSVLPVCMTYRASPPLEENISTLNFFRLYRISPSGVLGCFASGMILGAIYGLLPVLVGQEGFSLYEISLTMGLTIFGGMLLQYPVGHLSDHMDRRKVLIFLALACLILSLCLMVSVEAVTRTYFFVFVFLLGGFSFTLYPLSISHACDYLEKKDIVAATGGLLLAYGIGATIGPFIAPGFMKMMGPPGLLVYFALVSALLAAFVIWRRIRREESIVPDKQTFVVVSHTTPIANELDPRVEMSASDQPAEAEEN